MAEKKREKPNKNKQKGMGEEERRRGEEEGKKPGGNKQRGKGEQRRRRGREKEKNLAKRKSKPNKERKKGGKAISNYWKNVIFFTFADIGERKTGRLENQKKTGK